MGSPGKLTHLEIKVPHFARAYNDLPFLPASRRARARSLALENRLDKYRNNDRVKHAFNRADSRYAV